MAKRTREIVEKNEMYYQNYVVGLGRRFHKWTAYALIVINAIICCFISQSFKRTRFLGQAGAENLGEKEVMVWVDEQVRAITIDFWLIAGVAAMLILFIELVNRNVKGYDLYKKSWIRVLPVSIASVIFVLVIILGCRGQNIVTILATGIEWFQFVALFKFLLPLELRKSYGSFIDFIEKLSNRIIKKL